MNRSRSKKSSKKPARSRQTVAVDLEVVVELANYFRLSALSQETDAGCDYWNSSEEAAPYRDFAYARRMRETLRWLAYFAQRRAGLESLRATVAANDNGATERRQPQPAVGAAITPIRKREAA